MSYMLVYLLASDVGKTLAALFVDNFMETVILILVSVHYRYSSISLQGSRKLILLLVSNCSIFPVS